MVKRVELNKLFEDRPSRPRSVTFQTAKHGKDWYTKVTGGTILGPFFTEEYAQESGRRYKPAKRHSIRTG